MMLGEGLTDWLIPCPKCGRVHLLVDSVAEVDGVDSVRSAVETLTPAQYGVFIHMAGALSNRQLADEFVVTGETIKAHVNKIRWKLGADTREKVVLAANVYNAWRCAVEQSTDGG